MCDLGNRKRIAILTNHDDDIYCFRKELIEQLKIEGYDLLISCPYGPKLDLLNDIKYDYIDTKIDRRGTNIIKDFKLFMHYYKNLKKYKPDVVLTYTIKPNIYGSIAAKILGLKYINNITGFGSITNKMGVIKSLIINLLKIALKKSSCVFFQNKENMDYAINNNIVSDKYKLIPGSGVNTDRFALQEYPESSEKIVFNYIGRVLKDKSIDDYIKAAKILSSKYNNLEFNIIGFIEPTEMHYEELLNNLQSQGILIYRGAQNDVREFIGRSHCIIHPSTYGEGMSNVLLENASSGRPIITTNISGCKETVNDKVSGYIYKAGDINELILKIEKFIKLDNNERKEMGLNGRIKMEKEFSRKFVVDAYLSVIQKEINKYI